jgi:hypothetical protein
MKLTIEQIESIARELEAGLKVFVNTNSLELKTVGDWEKDSAFTEDKWKDILEELENNSDNYIEIEKMPQNEMLAVMESFADTLENENVKRQLELALSVSNPSVKFREIIKAAPEIKAKWLEFKHENCIDWIRTQIHHYNIKLKKQL